MTRAPSSMRAMASGAMTVITPRLTVTVMLGRGSMEAVPSRRVALVNAMELLVADITSPACALKPCSRRRVRLARFACG